MKGINQVVVFFVEIVMLVAFGYYGFQKGGTALLRYIAAVGLPLLVIVIWSRWAAPKSEHRVRWPYLQLLRLVLFLLAALALYACGLTFYSLILAVVATATQVISLLTEREAE